MFYFFSSVSLLNSYVEKDYAKCEFLNRYKNMDMKEKGKKNKMAQYGARWKR